MEPKVVPVFIAVGSNLGDRTAQIDRAIKLIDEVPEIGVVRCSRLIETAPVGMPADAGPFLNGAVELRTTMGADDLLAELQAIEKSMGRRREAQWISRTIDLDILLFGSQIISGEHLIVPHPMMHERLFVLEPMVEIAPDVVHPALQMSMRGLLDEIRNRRPDDSH